MTRFIPEWKVFLPYLAFTLIMLVGAFTPYWSINHLYFAPILLAAIPISYIFHTYKPNPWYLFGVLVCLLLFVHIQPSLLGDSYSLFADAARQKRLNYFQYPRYHSLLAPFLLVHGFGLFASYPSDFAVFGKWLSVFAGLLYYLLLTLNLKHYPKGALALYFVPAVVLFFGYIELYAVSILLWYLTLHYLYMQRKIAWVFAVVATAYQWSAGILLIMLVSQYLPKKWFYSMLGLGVLASPLLVFVSPDFTLHFSFDTVQGIFLAGGFGLFTVFTWKDSPFNRSLLCGIVCLLLMSFVFVAQLGWFRDWDTIAPLGLLLAFASLETDHLAGYVLGFLLWLGVNISSPLERFYFGLEKTSTTTEVQLSALENVRKYYEFEGDIPKELDVIQDMIVRGDKPYHYTLYVRRLHQAPDMEHTQWFLNKLLHMPTKSLLRSYEGVSIIRLVPTLTWVAHVVTVFSTQHTLLWNTKDSTK